MWRLARHPAVVVGIALGVGLGMWRPPQVGWPPDGWVMVACDVGQGDATVVATGDGSAMLVDVGPEPVAVDRCLDRLRVDRLPVVAITHAHADHVGGWSGAASGRDVGTVLVGPTGGPRAEAEPRRVVAGQRFGVGQLSVEVLWPAAAHAAPAESDGSADERREPGAARDADRRPSAPAAAHRRRGAGRPGGLAAAAPRPRRRRHQDAAPRQRPAVRSVLRRAVGARVATISAGQDNDYGHPAAAALRLLRDHHVAWWRTDTDGDIAVVVRDGRLSVVTRH